MAHPHTTFGLKLLCNQTANWGLTKPGLFDDCEHQYSACESSVAQRAWWHPGRQLNSWVGHQLQGPRSIVRCTSHAELAGHHHSPLIQTQLTWSTTALPSFWLQCSKASLDTDRLPGYRQWVLQFMYVNRHGDSWIICFGTGLQICQQYS